MDSLLIKLAGTLGVGYTILNNAFGVIAMVFCIIAFQFKNKVTIVVCNFLGQLCWVLYFIFLRDYTSAISCGISAAMLWAFSKQEKWKWVLSPVTVTIFAVIIAGFSISAFRVWADIFPVMAGVFGIIANSRKKESTFRKFGLLCYISWLMNSIFKMFPIALINDASCTISVAVSIYRYRGRDEKQKV